MKNTNNFTGKNILVVEDDSTSTLLLNVMLKDTGANISFVDNGAKAVNSVSDGNIDLILMDIKMPVMDGYTATKLIRSFNPTIPIIGYSAYALKEEVEKGLEIGCNAYLAKPVRKELLLHTIDKYLK